MNTIIPALYTTWYNGAPTLGSTAQLQTAIGYEYNAPNYDGNNNHSIEQDIYKYVQFENRVLGLARLRQLRVHK